jgi:hypothetical protein
MLCCWHRSFPFAAVENPGGVLIALTPTDDALPRLTSRDVTALAKIRSLATAFIPTLRRIFSVVNLRSSVMVNAHRRVAATVS